MEQVLDRYERASGQKLNLHKTSIYFSTNTSEYVREVLKDNIGARVCYDAEKYLGLPTMVGRSKYQAFREIKERVWKRINSWKNQFLTQAGKEILIKAIIQAIPTYAMSVFQLPKQLCKEISNMMARFWCRHMDNDRKIQWKEWSKVGIVKSHGRLGFRDIQIFNKAMLAKQFWRLLTKPHSLVARIMREKYFKHGDILSSRLGCGPSQIWRSI